MDASNTALTRAAALVVPTVGASSAVAADTTSRHPIKANTATQPDRARDGADAALVARGEYLANAAHCAACHTREGGKPYAGNLAINSPFGTMYSSNITPDAATGIGSWSEKDFEGALRRGVGKDGKYLYPSMPYLDFTRISDDDVHALWAYFQSLAPVSEKQKPNQMKFPFDVRLGIAGWQAMYFREGRYIDDPSQSPQWNRGAYLVEGLGHCGACHTPTNVAMAPKKGKALQGNVIDHWFAPDISGSRYSSIAKWSEPEVASFLKTGHSKHNQAAVGPMQTTIDFGLAKLSDADLASIATYLKNQGPTDEAAAKASRPLRADEAARERASGLALYVGNCATCHGPDGAGKDGIAPALARAASLNGKSSQTAIRAVLEGFPPQDRWGVMPSFGRVLGAQEIADVVNFTRTAWGNNGSERVTARLVNHVAIDVDIGNPKVESALVCPSAPTGELDDRTLALVKSASDDTKAGASASRIVQGFRATHPKVNNTDLVTAIGGAYCRNVMADSKGTLAERQQRYVSFMGNVAKAAARP